jgi:hypothetical protein
VERKDWTRGVETNLLLLRNVTLEEYGEDINEK